MAHPRCHACPLRQRRAFHPKSREEVDVAAGMKMDHRRIPAGQKIIFPGQDDAGLFTLYDRDFAQRPIL
ncbi:MAG: hypothetical protein Q8O26_16095 [Phreatobacter sp.]|uniref:hypothetical protein n=1 Tax=Phreatobacter sp. TaxID=1966341 RepID=UPI0027373367|nr:hypothetical protein [Phreatobacter sp.]MDP2803395.1 hypothetical protein [Phreatobacter sp.]